MDQGKLTIIVGGYLGDEGKGKATQYFIERTGRRLAESLRESSKRNILCVRSSGGTNTGATVYIQERKVSVHMLPAGALIPNCDCYIGTGCYVNAEKLLEELKMRERIMLSLGLPHFGRVFLSKHAHMVAPSYIEEDQKKEKEQGLGSTKNGVSIAASNKYSYIGARVEGNIEYPPIKEAIDKYRLEIVEPFELFEHTIIPKQYDIVLEGTQGVGLDVNHGFQYPFVSAGSFSTFGLLDGVGYALAPSEVCMVLKSYGSYFGPIRMGKADFDNDEFRKFAGEYGTTTGRPRNLCWLNASLLSRVSSLTRPTSIMLNCLDLLNWFPENGQRWGIIIDENEKIEFDDKPIVNRKLTNAGALFIQTIEEHCGAPVNFIGIGPKHTDIIER